MGQFPSRHRRELRIPGSALQQGDFVATITINRPQNYNAYSTRALEELATAFRDASFDDAVGVIVLTGAGHQAFCTGGDVKEYAEDYVTHAARLLEVHGALPRLHREHPEHRQAGHRAAQRHGGRRRQRDPSSPAT